MYLMSAFADSDSVYNYKYRNLLASAWNLLSNNLARKT